MASGYGPSAADEIEQLVTADKRYVRQITRLTVDRLVVVPGRIVNVVPR
jgi:leucyl-tRNA synthetase